MFSVIAHSLVITHSLGTTLHPAAKILHPKISQHFQKILLVVCRCGLISKFLKAGSICSCLHLYRCGIPRPTSLLTKAWAQAGGPLERCQHVLLEVTWGSWYPGNRTSCVAAPTLSPLAYHSRLGTSRLGPVTPSDRSPSDRDGEGGEGGGLVLWPQPPGLPARGRVWVERTGVSVVSFWPQPLTKALANLLLFSPSEDGQIRTKRGKHTVRSGSFTQRS